MCSLLYDTADGLVVSPHLVSLSKGVTFSSVDCNQSICNPIINDDKAHPLLNSVKEQATVLAGKFMPNYEMRN